MRCRDARRRRSSTNWKCCSSFTTGKQRGVRSDERRAGHIPRFCRPAMPRPISATIDLAALAHNLGVARAHAPQAKVFAVIKANAYGHGLLHAAGALRAGDGFAGLEVRRLAAVLHSDAQLPLLDALPANSRLDVLLKINSGMNRLGYAPDAV